MNRANVPFVRAAADARNAGLDKLTKLKMLELGSNRIRVREAPWAQCKTARRC